MQRFLGFAVLGLLTAGAANAQDSGGTPPPPPAPTAATTIPAPEWRTASAENLLVIDTTKGRILVELTPEAAPQHVERV